MRQHSELGTMQLVDANLGAGVQLRSPNQRMTGTPAKLARPSGLIEQVVGKRF